MTSKDSTAPHAYNARKLNKAKTQRNIYINSPVQYFDLRPDFLVWHWCKRKSPSKISLSSQTNKKETEKLDSRKKISPCDLFPLTRFFFHIAKVK